MRGEGGGEREREEEREIKIGRERATDRQTKTLGETDRQRGIETERTASIK